MKVDYAHILSFLALSIDDFEIPPLRFSSRLRRQFQLEFVKIRHPLIELLQ